MENGITTLQHVLVRIYAYTLSTDLTVVNTSEFSISNSTIVHDSPLKIGVMNAVVM